MESWGIWWNARLRDWTIGLLVWWLILTHLYWLFSSFLTHQVIILIIWAQQCSFRFLALISSLLIFQSRRPYNLGFMHSLSILKLFLFNFFEMQLFLILLTLLFLYHFLLEKLRIETVFVLAINYHLLLLECSDLMLGFGCPCSSLCIRA